MTCALADKDCHPPLQWHHAIKQQRLKREFKYGAYWYAHRYVAAHRSDPVTLPGAMRKTLNDILGDTRNRVWLCSHHHELVTNGRLKVQLPDSVWLFAAEFGLTGMLENDLARAA